MAEDQKHTGGMLALVPADPGQLAVDGGLDPSDLHLTLLHLGDDVSGWDPGQRDKLREMVAASAPSLDPVDARAFAHTVFNPDGGASGDMDPTVVYLIGDAPGIAPIRDWAQWATTTHDDYPTPPAQHDPYVPHVSAMQGSDPSPLSYLGPVRFNALRLALGGDSEDYPLGDQSDTDTDGDGGGEDSDGQEPPDGDGGDGWPELKGLTFTPPRPVRDLAGARRGAMAHHVYEGKALDGAGVGWVAEHCGEVGATWANEVRARAQTKGAQMAQHDGEVEYKRDVGTQERDKLADAGQTLKGGRSYPIKTLGDLDNAYRAWGHAKPADRPALKRLLKKMARKLGASQVVYDKIGALSPSGAGTESKAAPDTGIETGEIPVEVKVMSPDPRAAKLRNYWAFNPKGRAKWKPGTHGDFKRLRRHLAKFVKVPRVLNGLTANIHKLGTGFWPGPGKGPNRHKSLIVDWPSVEYKAAQMPDPADHQDLYDGIDEWGPTAFGNEDLSGYSPDVFEDDGGDQGDDLGDGMETKAVDPDLLATSRLAAIGDSIVADTADGPDDQGADDVDDDLESYEDTVDDDDVWLMDADGVMHRLSEPGDAELTDTGAPALFEPSAYGS